MKNASCNDMALLYEMQKGNQKAFDLLFYKYYPILCTYGLHFVSLEDTEEIVQDVLLWLWENRNEALYISSIKNYLFKSVYNRSINRITQNETKQQADTIFFERMVATLQETDILQVTELSKHAKAAIDKLPTSYKEAFLMHRFQNLSYKEIGDLLGVSPKTIDYRIQQSLKILRVELKEYLSLLLPLLTIADSFIKKSC